jgi:hypothetical protein
MATINAPNTQETTTVVMSIDTKMKVIRVPAIGMNAVVTITQSFIGQTIETDDGTIVEADTARVTVAVTATTIEGNIVDITKTMTDVTLTEVRSEKEKEIVTGIAIGREIGIVLGRRKEMVAEPTGLLRELSLIIAVAHHIFLYRQVDRHRLVP